MLYICVFIFYTMLIEKRKVELRDTEDGSHTLYLPDIDETYHSIHGAVNESTHVFLRAGLDMCMKTSIRVLEVGFGTGLNAYLTALEAEKRNVVIDYVSIEKFPLTADVYGNLNFGNLPLGNKTLFQMLHDAQWGVMKNLTSLFCIEKIESDFTALFLQREFDVIYYDAFSPDKQPELWTEAVFEELFALTASGGVLTTYCAKGAVRRAMQAAGYSVERIPGPVGKREMLRATKL